MKTAIFSAIIGASFVWAIFMAVDTNSQAYAKGTVSHPSKPGQLIALTESIGDTHQQVTVIDPTRKVMSVYHINKTSGAIKLQSVRNMTWDLQMLEFNSKNPTPHEIRSHYEKNNR